MFGAVFVLSFEIGIHSVEKIADGQEIDESTFIEQPAFELPPETLAIRVSIAGDQDQRGALTESLGATLLPDTASSPFQIAAEHLVARRRSGRPAATRERSRRR